MVTHDWTLASAEGEGLCPAQANTNAKLTDPCVLVDASRIASYIQTRDAYPASNLGDTHNVVEHCSRCLSCTRTVAACLKAYTVDSSVYHGLTEDLFDHLGQRGISPHVNSFTTKAACLCEPVGVQITHDNHGCTKQLRRSSACQPDRSSTGDIYSRSRCHTSSDSSMIPSREDLLQHVHFLDLLHRLILVLKLSAI